MGLDHFAEPLAVWPKSSTSRPRECEAGMIAAPKGGRGKKRVAGRLAGWS